MRVRMKFVVPLTIPSTRWTFVTTSDSRSTLITGIAAHTDASKRSCTPASAAAAKSSVLRRASELLVRGHDRLPGPQQLENVIARRRQAAHHLRDDRDRLVVADHGEVRRQHAVVGLELTLLVDVTDERAHEPEPMPGRALDVLCAVGQEPRYRAADRPVPEECDRYVNRHSALRPAACASSAT